LTASQLGESVDWLHEVAGEMDTEDGVIWVYGGDRGVFLVHFDEAREGLDSELERRSTGK
jgi:hypothetical protein